MTRAGQRWREVACTSFFVIENLVLSFAPGGLTGGPTGTTLGVDVLAAAAVGWFVALLALAMWVFHKKAAE